MVHSDLLNNSGAYIVQELGYALAWGNEYLQQAHRCRRRRRPCRKEDQVLHGCQRELLYGDCEVPCRPFAVGTDCQAV